MPGQNEPLDDSVVYLNRMESPYGTASYQRYRDSSMPLSYRGRTPSPQSQQRRVIAPQSKDYTRALLADEDDEMLYEQSRSEILDRRRKSYSLPARQQLAVYDDTHLVDYQIPADYLRERDPYGVRQERRRYRPKQAEQADMYYERVRSRQEQQRNRRDAESPRRRHYDYYYYIDEDDDERHAPSQRQRNGGGRRRSDDSAAIGDDDYYLKSYFRNFPRNTGRRYDDNEEFVRYDDDDDYDYDCAHQRPPSGRSSSAAAARSHFRQQGRAASDGQYYYEQGYGDYDAVRRRNFRAAPQRQRSFNESSRASNYEPIPEMYEEQERQASRASNYDRPRSKASGGADGAGSEARSMSIDLLQRQKSSMSGVSAPAAYDRGIPEEEGAGTDGEEHDYGRDENNYSPELMTDFEDEAEIMRMLRRGKTIDEIVPDPGLKSLYIYKTRGPDKLELFNRTEEVMDYVPEDHYRAPICDIKLRSHTIWEKMYVKFTCTVKGKPLPKVTWYKNMIPIQPMISDAGHIKITSQYGVHTLEIYRANLDDAGTYRVSAQNCKGEVSSFATLVVKRYQPGKTGLELLTLGQLKSKKDDDDKDGKDGTEDKKEEKEDSNMDEEAKRKADEEARSTKENKTKAGEEEQARLKAEEEARQKTEEETKKKAEEEKQARLKAEEESRLKAEKEAGQKAEEEKKKKAEQEAKNKAEEDAKKKKTEEDAKKKKAEEDAKKKKTEEDAKKKKTEEDAKKKKVEEDAKKKKAEEDAKKKKAEEDAKKNKAEEDAKKKKAEEDAKKNKAEEEIKKNEAKEEVEQSGTEQKVNENDADEEAEKKKAVEEAKKKKAEQDAQKKKAEEDAKKKKAEEDTKKKKAEEDTKKKKAEEDAKKKKAEEEANKKKAEEDAKKKKAEEEAKKMKAAEEEANENKVEEENQKNNSEEQSNTLESTVDQEQKSEETDKTETKEHKDEATTEEEEAVRAHTAEQQKSAPPRTEEQRDEELRVEEELFEELIHQSQSSKRSSMDSTQEKPILPRYTSFEGCADDSDDGSGVFGLPTERMIVEDAVAPSRNRGLDSAKLEDLLEEASEDDLLSERSSSPSEPELTREEKKDRLAAEMVDDIERKMAAAPPKSFVAIKANIDIVKEDVVEVAHVRVVQSPTASDGNASE